ncbi:MerR family transcriptional regulator [Aquipuribacter nitratireducens]|uniref:MerR family transcriptional regulator n=1 Tax=Aquipuribacter nitratireducens TaxID=650104 RepID=A0ABW0GRA6_9MICO
MSSVALAREPRGGSGGGLTIGEVLGVLREEFPDVTISKIRFLEEQGLVEPDRTPSGYRKFSAGHVERLRRVLVLQRDHFLPLRVIREQLDTGAPLPGGTVGSGASGPSALAPFVRAVAEPGADEGTTLDRSALAQRSGASDALVEELERHGLVRPGPDGAFGADDLEVARAAAALGEHGVEPRHLRAFRSAADKEVDLVRQVVAPLRRTGRPGSAGQAADTAREVAAACLRLHAALVAGSLDRL